MEWFTVWWQGLGIVGQIMACAAIPMTVIMLLQLVLMLIGLGPGGDSDGELDDGGFDDVGHDVGHGGGFHDGGFHDVGHDGGFHDGGFHDVGHDGGFDDGGFHDVGHDGGFDDGGLDDGGFNDAGFHEGNFDHVFETHFHHHANGDGSHTNSIWRIFTVRGIVAFFALGGWAGLAALTSGVPVFWSIQIALFSGLAALMLASIAIRLALRMQDSGNINLNNALSLTAEVYITIPPSRANTGKVTMLLQERFVELDAVTDSEEEIRPKTKVEVVGLASRDCLVVSPAETDNGDADSRPDNEQ